MYDQAEEWVSRFPIDVDHLVGYNLSIRRCAFKRFESNLKPYWQMFEIDVCLQVKTQGYRVIFDFANVVAHYPTNRAYAGGRDGELQVKIFNAVYNQAFVLAKHSPWHLRFWRLIYLLLVGSVGSPGLLSSLLAMTRYGHPLRELKIFFTSWHYKMAGWKSGLDIRRSLFR
jgi:hypothetical protein